MARATSKSDLMKSANEQFDKLLTLIESMSEEEKNAPFDFGDTFKQKEAHWNRDKNLRDVLVHLYEWHQLLLNYILTNQRGEETPFLPTPYNWKSYGVMNENFWKKHQDTPLNSALSMLKESHAQVLELIEGFTNDELFTHGSLPWVKTNTLGSYCVSNTGSHYDWAIKKVKAHKKTFQPLIKFNR